MATAMTASVSMIFDNLFPMEQIENLFKKYILKFPTNWIKWDCGLSINQFKITLTIFNCGAGPCPPPPWPCPPPPPLRWTTTYFNVLKQMSSIISPYLGFLGTSALQALYLPDKHIHYTSLFSHFLPLLIVGQVPSNHRHVRRHHVHDLQQPKKNCKYWGKVEEFIELSIKNLAQNFISITLTIFNCGAGAECPPCPPE